jgi:hypothetical protein
MVKLRFDLFLARARLIAVIKNTRLFKRNVIIGVSVQYLGLAFGFTKGNWEKGTLLETRESLIEHSSRRQRSKFNEKELIASRFPMSENTPLCPELCLTICPELPCLALEIKICKKSH